MTKLTWQELVKIINDHNSSHGVDTQFGDEHPLKCVVVYKVSNWPDKDYSLESRSYRFRSDNKRFVPNMGGNSIFGSALDGSDDGVRLDCAGWEKDYCYIEWDFETWYYDDSVTEDEINEHYFDYLNFVGKHEYGYNAEMLGIAKADDFDENEPYFRLDENGTAHSCGYAFVTDEARLDEGFKDWMNKKFKEEREND